MRVRLMGRFALVFIEYKTDLALNKQLIIISLLSLTVYSLYDFSILRLTVLSQNWFRIGPKGYLNGT